MTPDQQRPQVGCASAPITAADNVPPWERVKENAKRDERPLPSGFEGCESRGPELTCFEGKANRGAW
jgi:hypothetical protein